MFLFLPGIKLDQFMTLEFSHPDCAVLENIHTASSQGQWKGGGWWQKQKSLKKSMELNWNFQRGGDANQENLCWWGVWIYSGTTRLLPVSGFFCFINLEHCKCPDVCQNTHTSFTETVFVSICYFYY